MTQRPGRLEPYRAYHARIEVRGTNVRCLLDGQVVHEFALPEAQHVYAQTALNGADELIVKLVNPTATPVDLALNLKNFAPKSGRLITLSSANGTDENSMAEPNKVAPRERDYPISAQALKQFHVPPFSLNILRLKR